MYSIFNRVPKRVITTGCYGIFTYLKSAFALHIDDFSISTTAREIVFYI